VGGIDTPAAGAALAIDRLATLSGWFVDTSAEGWTGADDLQVFSGVMGGGGTSLGHGTLGLPRSDIAASLNNAYWSAAGWSAVIDPGALALGDNTLSVYVHTPAKGWWFTQLAVAVVPSGGGISGLLPGAAPPILSVAAPVQDERISIHLPVYRVTGTARDPVAGARAIDRVQVWLNGEQNTDNASFIGDADIATDGSWELDFSPWKFTPLTSNMYVYAHSDLSNRTTLAVIHFVITDKPV
jgi:hypothetical protein